MVGVGDTSREEGLNMSVVVGTYFSFQIGRVLLAPGHLRNNHPQNVCKTEITF